jgi:hypothetical protein
MRRAAVQKGNLETSAEESLFRRRIPCSDRRNSLLSEEQGIRCKPLNQFGDRRAKPTKETAIWRNFQQFPVNFPVLREMRTIAT